MAAASSSAAAAAAAAARFSWEKREAAADEVSLKGFF